MQEKRRRPVTISHPRERLPHACFMVIDMSGKKSRHLLSVKHRNFSERKSRSTRKVRDFNKTLDESKHQITNIIIHKEPVPRPRLAPIPTAFVSTANTTVLISDAKP